MSIEALENASNILNNEKAFANINKNLNKAVNSHQNPGSHSGMTRLAQDERLQVSISRKLHIIFLKEMSIGFETRILGPTGFNTRKGG